MKRIVSVFFISVFLLCLISCHGFFQLDDRSIETKMAHKIAVEVIEDLRLQYNLNCCGIREAGPKGKYVKIGLDFFSNKILTKSEGRFLILKCLDKMLAKFNGDPNFSPYMENGKFTLGNLSVSIYPRAEDRPHVYYPDFSVFSFSGGKLHYLTEAPNVRGWRSEEEETYEEALRLVDENAN